MSHAGGGAGRGLGRGRGRIEEGEIDGEYIGYLRWLLTNHRRIEGIEAAMRRRRPRHVAAPADEHSVAESACTEVAEEDEVLQPIDTSITLRESSGSRIRTCDVVVQEDQPREGDTPERPLMVEDGDDEASSSRPSRGRRSSRYFLRRRG